MQSLIYQTPAEPEEDLLARVYGQDGCWTIRALLHNNLQTNNIKKFTCFLLMLRSSGRKEIAATLQNRIQIFVTWLPAFQKGMGWGWVEDVKVCLGL